MKLIFKIVLFLSMYAISSVVLANTITVENHWVGGENYSVISEKNEPVTEASIKAITRDSSVEYTVDFLGNIKNVCVETPESAISFKADRVWKYIPEGADDNNANHQVLFDDKMDSWVIINHGVSHYNTFGTWADGRGNVSGAFVDGSETNVIGIPVSGKAVYSGSTLGHYINKDGLKDYIYGLASMQVDFVSRSIDFKTNNIQEEDKQLNLSGTLKWQNNTNAFTGVVSTASGALSGTADGGFYGPSAEAAAGVFSLGPKDGVGVESYIGAFGTTRE